MTRDILLLNKPPVLTPLQAIQRLRAFRPELENTKIGYAGRLDPMAEGLLLLLVGDENKRKHRYENFSKVYEFQVLFGIESDTYDIMGLVKRGKNLHLNLQTTKSAISHELKQFVGTHEQTYPPYSSVRVKGKPLFYWAREGALHKIAIPKKKITITEARLMQGKEVKLSEIVPEILKKISSVKGNFRQKEIIARWRELAESSGDCMLPLLSITVACSSGTYMRSIAHDLGARLGTGALAFSIKRTHIGTFQLRDAISIET